MASARKKRRDTQYTIETCTVRITRQVKQWIVKRARYQESVDSALRRFLGIPNGKKGWKTKPSVLTGGRR